MMDATMIIMMDATIMRMLTFQPIFLSVRDGEYEDMNI
jgi:hypothetical protein